MKKPETNGKKTERNQTPEIEITSVAVRNVKMWDSGSVTFTLELNGVTIYGCRVVETKKGDFIAFPSRKGNDGKYYSHAYAKLSEDDQESIIEEVEKLLNE